MANIRKLFFLTALLGIALMGCSSEMPTPDLSVTPFPLGTYKQMEWVWVFEEDGTYYYYSANEPDDIGDGSYTVTGDQIVIKDDMCPGGDEGTYQWEFDGKALSLKTISDNCSGRSTWNTRLPWSLEQ